jgi:bifunctional oligoribonuclease and PAP phosphatase NrnA
MSQSDTKLAVAVAPGAPSRSARRTHVSVETIRIEAILDALRRGQRFLVCSHAQPDGDSVGSMLALGMVLEQMGKVVELVAADTVPAHYRHLPGVDAIQTRLRVHGPYDAAILLECDSVQRTKLRGLEDFYQINIDHHVSGQEFAHLNWIDHEAASAGEMVFRLAQAAGARLTPQMATCLYITVLTDTGGFCYGAVRESTFALARELVLAGADPVAIAQDVYFSAPVSKLLLLGAALGRLHCENRLAWLWVTHADSLASHATEDDSDGIVDYALGVEGVEAAFFLRELPEGRVRVSLRSKGRINVAAIAEHLGGGGHENAAGCTLDGPLARACEEVLAHLRPAVAELSFNPA